VARAVAAMLGLTWWSQDLGYRAWEGQSFTLAQYVAAYVAERRERMRTGPAD
jgi:hypothetical protein